VDVRRFLDFHCGVFALYYQKHFLVMFNMVVLDSVTGTIKGSRDVTYRWCNCKNWPQVSEWSRLGRLISANGVGRTEFCATCFTRMRQSDVQQVTSNYHSSPGEKPPHLRYLQVLLEIETETK